MELNIECDIFYDEEEELRKEKRKERRREREKQSIPDHYIPNQRELNWFLVRSYLYFHRMWTVFLGRL